MKTFGEVLDSWEQKGGIGENLKADNLPLISAYCGVNLTEAAKRKDETDSQFLYKNRKQAIGPFKEQFWNLPAGTREAIRDTLEKKFAFLFDKLAVARTRDLVARYVEPAALAGGELAGVTGPRAAYVRDDEAGD